ncbi:hypothetical protein ANTQUA_LOCUS6592 [Anthophora quadrimaculata]
MNVLGPVNERKIKSVQRVCACLYTHAYKLLSEVRKKTRPNDDYAYVDILVEIQLQICRYRGGLSAAGSRYYSC